MKNIFILVVLFIAVPIVAQNQNTSLVSNQADTFVSLARGNVNKYGGSTRFVNPPKEVMGSIYLFDNWDNRGVMYTKSNKKFIVNNINLNMERNVIQARFAKDTIFTYYFNNIDKFIVNGKVYKSLFSEDGKKLYEIVYESDNFSIIKGFHVEYVSGSVNPMLRRLNDKYVRVQTFYVKKDDEVIKHFKFSKSKVLKLIGDQPERMRKFEQFMEENSLSYRKSEDVKKALVYSEQFLNL